MITIHKAPYIGFVCGLAALLLAGCGGGGGSSVTTSSTDRSQGTVALKLTFPASRAAAAPKRGAAKTRAYGGNIPIGTKVVHLVVTNTTSGAVLASRDVVGPTNSDGTLPNLVSVEFPAIPAGPVTVTATAFPDAASALHAIATGSTTATVQPLLTTDVTVPMSLTITGLTIDKPTATIFTDLSPRTVVLTALPVNATGGALALPLYWTTSDPGIASLVVNPSNPAQVTITGVADGTSTITVYEPNSEKIATATITVESD